LYLTHTITTLPQPVTNITAPKLDPDGSFRVKEFTCLTLVAAMVFYGLFFMALINVAGQKAALGHQRSFMHIMLLCLLPAILFTYKAIRQRVYVTVNETGIYLYETLITTWPNFIDAMYIDEQKTRRLEDHYVLYIYYYKDGKETHQTRFQLGGTQNRTEEEIIAAIRYFYVQSGFGVGE